MIDFSTLKAIQIPEGNVIKITSGSSVLWEAPAKYKNWVPVSTDSTGAIYNETGYKAGYRVRSGGAEAADTRSVCTGFIPFTVGDTLRLTPAFTGLNTNNAINYYDASYTNLGQRTNNGSGYGICINASGAIYTPVNADGVSTLMLPNTADTRVRYVRITNDTAYTDGSNMIVTINEDIK